MESPNSTCRVLIISPMGMLREGLAALVGESPRFEVIGVRGTGAEALSALSSSCADIALVDSDLSDVHFIDLLQGIAEVSPQTRSLCLISTPEMHLAATAMLRGARGIVTVRDTSRQLISALEQVFIGSTYISKTVEVNRIFRRSTPAFTTAADSLDTLSMRESQVYHYLIQGIRPKEIAFRLGISPKTVDTFRASLMRKLNVDSKVDLVKYSLRRTSYLAAVENSGRTQAATAKA